MLIEQINQKLDTMKESIQKRIAEPTTPRKRKAFLVEF